MHFSKIYVHFRSSGYAENCPLLGTHGQELLDKTHKLHLFVSGNTKENRDVLGNRILPSIFHIHPCDSSMLAPVKLKSIWHNYAWSDTLTSIKSPQSSNHEVLYREFFQCHKSESGSNIFATKSIALYRKSELFFNPF